MITLHKFVQAFSLVPDIIVTGSLNAMENFEKKSTNNEFPYAINEIKGVIRSKLVNDFPTISRDGMVQIGPAKWIMPTKYEQFAKRIYNFKARADDVWICTFPRSGSTWTAEMIWLLCNDLDYDTALKTSLHSRFTFFEVHTLADPSTLATFRAVSGPIYESLDRQTTRRFIKTHVPMKLLPSNIMEVGAKIVYVARNPTDVAVSYYHFHQANPILGFKGDFESFLQYFMDDLVLYGPYWKHVLDGWNNRHRDNVHFMFYEDSNLDLEKSLKSLADFLGKPLRDDDLGKLMDHLKFENVQKNPSISVNFVPRKKKNDLIRRGKVGGNPEITEEIARKIDQWTEKNLGNSELKFPHC